MANGSITDSSGAISFGDENISTTGTISSGSSTLSSLTVSGATALNGGLSMDTNKFTVADTSGNVATAGTLAVTGASTLSSTLDVTGDTSVSTFDSSGATSLATGGGAVNVATSGVMTTVKGTLNVDEAVTLDTTLDVTGDTSVSTFDSSGATSLATGGGAVNVATSGVMTTVKGTLNVDEAVTLDTTLDVTGNTTFAGTVTAGNLLSYGDGTNVNTFIQGRSSAGYYSGIKLARGAGNWSNDSNNHFGMVVTDNGLELAKFTALGDNATGKAVYMTMAEGGNTTFSADVTAGSITDGTATLSSGALSGVTTISTSGNVTSSGGSISGFDAALNDQTSTSYSLQSSDNGKVVTLSNASAITLTIPSGLGDGFNCLIVQKGAGQITLSASGTTLINRQSHTKTAGQYAVVSIVNIGSDSIIVGGDTGS